MQSRNKNVAVKSVHPSISLATWLVTSLPLFVAVTWPTPVTRTSALGAWVVCLPVVFWVCSWVRCWPACCRTCPAYSPLCWSSASVTPSPSSPYCWACPRRGHPRSGTGRQDRPSCERKTRWRRRSSRRTQDSSAGPGVVSLS